MMRFITIQPSNKYLGIFFRTCFQSSWQIKGILLYSLNWYSRPWRFAIQDPQDPCMVLCIPTYGWFHFCMLNLGKNIPVPWIHLAKRLCNCFTFLQALYQIHCRAPNRPSSSPFFSDLLRDWDPRTQDP